MITPPTPDTGAVRRRLAIFVLVEGLGYELVRAHDFAPSLELKVGLPSVPGSRVAAQATLLSGRMPAEHGRLEELAPRADGAPLAPDLPWALLPSWVADSGWARERILRKLEERYRRVVRLPACPTRELPGFQIAHEDPLFGLGGLGAVPTVFDRLVEDGVGVRIVEIAAEAVSDAEELAVALRHPETEFLFLRVTGLPGALRRHGTLGAQLESLLERLGRGLVDLLGMAESMVEEVELFVFGDQGPAEVHSRVDVGGWLRREFGRNGADYHAVLGESYVRVLPRDPAVGERLAETIGREFPGRVLPEDERRELGTGHWGVRDLFFALDAGVAVVPSFDGTTMPRAAFGYHPDVPASQACLLGNFSPSLDVAHLRDLHHLMHAAATRVLEDRA